MVSRSMKLSRFNLVFVCTVIFLCLSVLSYASQKDVTPQADGAIAIVQVNINTANVEQLSTLPGVGAALAERIIKYRTEVGNFNTPAELIAVKGVGQKKLDKMLSLIVVK